MVDLPQFFEGQAGELGALFTAVEIIDERTFVFQASCPLPDLDGQKCYWTRSARMIRATWISESKKLILEDIVPLQVEPTTEGAQDQLREVLAVLAMQLGGIRTEFSFGKNESRVVLNARLDGTHRGQFEGAETLRELLLYLVPLFLTEIGEVDFTLNGPARGHLASYFSRS